MFSDGFVGMKACGDVMLVSMDDRGMKLSRVRSIWGKDDSHFSSCLNHNFRRGNLNRRSLNKNGGGVEINYHLHEISCRSRRNRVSLR